MIPREWIQILPYVLTMVALAGYMGRHKAPAALGVPFIRE
jgi:simple sugar transport system permease protein